MASTLPQLIQLIEVTPFRTEGQNVIKLGMKNPETPSKTDDDQEKNRTWNKHQNEKKEIPITD